MKKPKTGEGRYAKYGFFFIAPFVLVFLVFQLYPVVYTVFLGFTDSKGMKREFDMVGARNFVHIFYEYDLKDVSGSVHDVLTDRLDALKVDYDSEETKTAVPAAEKTAKTDSAATGDFSFGSSGSDDPFGLGAKGSGNSKYDMYLYDVATTARKSIEEALAASGVSADAIGASRLEKKTGVFFDKFFWKAFANNWIIWAMNFIPQLLFALLIAILFTDIRLKLRGGRFWKTVFYMPNIINYASVAVLFATLFYFPAGPINQFLYKAGFVREAVDFYRSPELTRGIVAFIQFWMWYGNTMIMLIAGISGISSSYFEAAIVDGATATQVITKITLPLLRPVMMYVLITSMIGGMQMFDIPYLLTNRRGDPDTSIMTTPVYIYIQAFTNANNYSYASAISIVLFLLTCVLSVGVFFLLRDKENISGRRLKGGAI